MQDETKHCVHKSWKYNFSLDHVKTYYCVHCSRNTFFPSNIWLLLYLYLWAAQGEVINDDYDQLRTTHFLICLLCVCLVIIWSIHNGYTVNCAILMVIGHSKYEWIWEIYIFHLSIYFYLVCAQLSVLNALNLIFKTLIFL